MATLRMYGDTSGYTDIAVPDVGTNGEVTLPASGEMITATTGTFTPAFVNGTFTYTGQHGNYYRIGDLVWVCYRLLWSASSGTGALQVSGFPFITKDDSDIFSNLSVSYLQGWEISATDAPPFFYYNANSSTLLCYYATDNAVPTPSVVQDLSGGSGQIILSGVVYIK